jgi:uncharacterized protein (TIGR03435 family)
MFERYTEGARRTLFFARYEASQLGSASIEARHLVLAVIRESQEITQRVFAEAAVSLRELRHEFEEVPPPHSMFGSVEMPFSDEVKSALAAAEEEADRFMHEAIGPEHLLLGVLRSDHSPAAKLLTSKGIRLETVREAIVAAAAVSGSPGRGEPLLTGLKAVIAYAWEGDQRYVDMADDDERRGFLMMQPHAHSHVDKEELREAIANRFGLTVTREERPVDAYAVTVAPDGPGPALRRQGRFESGSGVIQSGFSRRRGAPTRDRRTSSIYGFSAEGMPMPVICRSLETILRRPVINETNLDGLYDVELTSTAQTVDDFIQALRDEAGLVVTFATRNVAHLVVRRG